MKIRNAVFFLVMGLACTAGKYSLDRISYRDVPMLVPSDLRDAPSDLKQSHDEDSWFMILSPAPKKVPEADSGTALARSGPRAGARIALASTMIMTPMGYTYAVPMPRDSDLR